MFYIDLAGLESEMDASSSKFKVLNGIISKISSHCKFFFLSLFYEFKINEALHLRLSKQEYINRMDCNTSSSRLIDVLYYYFQMQLFVLFSASCFSVTDETIKQRLDNGKKPMSNINVKP